MGPAKLPRASRSRHLLGTSVLACALGTTSLAQAPPAARPSTIESVDVAPASEGDGATITIQADGSLPVPRVGVLDAPDRIYLDFAGVRLPSRVRADAQDTDVRGVRLAQHSLDPLVARIVVDLHGRTAHRTDVSSRLKGKVTLLLGPVLPVARAAGELPARQSGAARYGEQVSEPLARLQALRPVIEYMDGRVVMADSDLGAVAAELDSLHRTLAGVRPPAPLATTHDLLLRSCALAARAARMRALSITSGDPAMALNAGSAAAGALIVLDRAIRDLRAVPSP